MRGLSKRFVNQKGQTYDVHVKTQQEDDSVGFFGLWRYASRREVAATCAGVLLAWGSSLALVAAVVSYGELTALFVTRHAAAPAPPDAYVLRAFGGGRLVVGEERAQHMDALVQDSLAYGAASLAVMAAQLLCAAAAVSLVTGAQASMMARLRHRLLRALLSQECAFFDTNTDVNFTAMLTEQMDRLGAGVGERVVMAAYLLGSVVGGAALGLAYGATLTLAAASVVPPAALAAALVAKYQSRYSAQEAAADGRAARVLEEVLAGVATVRAYGAERHELQRYERELRRGGGAAARRGVCAGAGAGAGWLLTYATSALVFAAGGALCARDLPLPPDQRHYHPGVVVTVLFCSFISAQNIAMLQPHLEALAAARGAARALYALVRRAPSPARATRPALRPERLRGDIVFDNLHFAYPARPDVKVLRGVSLHVAAGETVALVGPSGCGKSTLLQLLLRLYTPAAGHISLDGHKLDELDPQHYRQRIGVVGQQPVLFSGSVRDNIALGARGVSQQDVTRAAQLAHAHAFISNLPQGYETVVGAGGGALSGGQAQRVALARALLRAPTLLLLDEPTAALDPHSERQVQAALDAASRGRTTLVVSHRLATIVNATRIVYMEQGRVLEQGSHQELVARRGHYWRLLQSDLAHADADQQSVDAPLAEKPTEEEAAGGREQERDNRPALHRTVSRQSTQGSARGLSPAPAHLPLPLSLSLNPLADAAEIEESLEEEQDKEIPASTWALFKLNAPEWPYLLGGSIASTVVGATMPAFAVLFSKFYGMFSSADPEEIRRVSAQYAAMFAGVAALCGAVCFLQSWLFHRAGAAMLLRLRLALFDTFVRQPQRWLDEPRHGVGALCARVCGDTLRLRGATGTRLAATLQGIATLGLGVTLAMIYSWKMTLVSLLSLPFVVGGIWLEGAATRRAVERARRAGDEAARVAQEALAHAHTVHALGVEEEMLSRYRAALEGGGAAAGGRAARGLRGLVYGLCLCAPTLGYAVSLAYGGYLIAREDMPYEYAILVSEALVYGAWMLAEALASAPDYAAARRAGARVRAALADAPPADGDDTQLEHDTRWFQSVSGEVNISNVWFTYPGRAGAAGAVLRGLSLHVPARSTVALVGTSGSGKSTLLQLLLRNYDVDSGSIEIDGRDIAGGGVSAGAVRACVGVVPQRAVLWAGSLRDNIAYGAVARDAAGGVTQRDVLLAAQQAHAHHFILALPQGYETAVGAGGGALSGGQAQRVALARALLRQPRLLLLDEATSALDAASELAVQRALEAAAASRARTTIIVAHRLSTVRRADCIHVLHQGVVAESGTHEQLLQRRGLYWELLQQQAGDVA